MFGDASSVIILFRCLPFFLFILLYHRRSFSSFSFSGNTKLAINDKRLWRDAREKRCFRNSACAFSIETKPRDCDARSVIDLLARRSSIRFCYYHTYLFPQVLSGMRRKLSISWQHSRQVYGTHSLMHESRSVMLEKRK